MKSSTISAPLRGCTPHFACKKNIKEMQLKALRLGNADFDHREVSDATATEYSIEIGPGDVLYHPAGVWHKVECLEDSIAINISLIASSYAEVFVSNLLQLLMKNEHWRAPVQTRNVEAAHGVVQELINGTSVSTCEISKSTRFHFK